MLSERCRFITVSCNMMICQWALPRLANAGRAMDDETNMRISAAMNAGTDDLQNGLHVVHHGTALHNVIVSSNIVKIRTTLS